MYDIYVKIWITDKNIFIDNPVFENIAAIFEGSTILFNPFQYIRSSIEKRHILEKAYERYKKIKEDLDVGGKRIKKEFEKLFVIWRRAQEDDDPIAREIIEKVDLEMGVEKERTRYTYHYFWFLRYRSELHPLAFNYSTYLIMKKDYMEISLFPQLILTRHNDYSKYNAQFPVFLKFYYFDPENPGGEEGYRIEREFLSHIKIEKKDDVIKNMIFRNFFLPAYIRHGKYIESIQWDRMEKNIDIISISEEKYSYAWKYRVACILKSVEFQFEIPYIKKEGIEEKKLKTALSTYSLVGFSPPFFNKASDYDQIVLGDIEKSILPKISVDAEDERKIKMRKWWNFSSKDTILFLERYEKEYEKNREECHKIREKIQIPDRMDTSVNYYILKRCPKIRNTENFLRSTEPLRKLYSLDYLESNRNDPKNWFNAFLLYGKEISNHITDEKKVIQDFMREPSYLKALYLYKNSKSWFENPEVRNMIYTYAVVVNPEIDREIAQAFRREIHERGKLSLDDALRITHEILERRVSRKEKEKQKEKEKTPKMPFMNNTFIPFIIAGSTLLAGAILLGGGGKK